MKTNHYAPDIVFVPETRIGFWFLGTQTWTTHVRSVALDDLERLMPQRQLSYPLVLDAGCGQGKAFRLLIEHFSPQRLIGVDAEVKCLQHAQAEALKEEIPIELRHCDIAALDVADASVDLAGCYSVLHHVPDYLALVDELTRVVRPGGVILVEHEKAPQYWAPSEALEDFLQGAVTWPEKRWTRFLDPRRYWARLRPLLTWQRWGNPRWMPEGDLHIWPDDHVEWDQVEARLLAGRCEIVRVTDHLAYEPRFDRAAWEEARATLSDTRCCIARKRA